VQWLDLSDEDVEGGAMTFDSRLELQIFKRRGEGEVLALWLSDDEEFICPVELGRA
jgi:hypothetical protein